MSTEEKTKDHILLEEWQKNLAALRTRKDSDGDKWLQILYGSYLQRLLSDNNRIWTTGQWMISLSLAPFAAISSLKHPLEFISVLFLAIPSISLDRVRRSA